MSRALRTDASVDVTPRSRIGAHFELALTALTLFNAKTQAIATASPFDTPFDIINASAVGRLIAAGVTAQW